MRYLGLDIGGANLKAADGRGRAVQVPFPLWKTPERLTDELRAMFCRFDGFDGVAVTMTGELCDCFASKNEGVSHIVTSLVRATEVRPLRIWTTGQGFVDAGDDCRTAAAANWLALAAFAGRLLRTGPSLLIDLGSTTCDVVPLHDGRPQPVGLTDPDRLRSGELVYCGVGRTPLCAIFGLTKAAELFATTEDAYVTLGDLPERPEATDTADGRPMTRADAIARLARMECDDLWNAQRAEALARQVRDLQLRRIAESVRIVAERLPGPAQGVMVSGAGEFLVPAILQAAGLGAVRRISLTETLGPDVSTAACAHAVAVLAEETT